MLLVCHHALLPACRKPHKFLLSSFSRTVAVFNELSQEGLLSANEMNTFLNSISLLKFMSVIGLIGCLVAVCQAQIQEH